jgi:cytochrome P450
VIELGHVDPHGPGYVAQREALFARLREQAPVARSSAHGGFVYVTRYDDVRRVLLDPETFSSAFPGRVAVPPTEPGRTPLPPIEFDPPRQTEQVALLAPFFGAAQVARHAPAVTAAARELLAPLVAAGGGDVVDRLGLPLVSRALAAFLELPDTDADLWVDWAHRLFATRTERPDLAAAARAEITSYVADLLEDRRRAPRGDVLSAVANGHVEGAPMPHDEAVGYGVMLLLAGRDASVDGVATSLVHLARHPGQQDALRADPALLPRAVEELLRLYAPIQQLGRVTVREVELAGTVLPADTSVAVVYGSANRDPSAFDRPDEAVLDRRRNRHLAFGLGVHRCLGAQLARLVLVTALREALAAARWSPDPAWPPVDKTNGDTRGYATAVLRAEPLEAP